MAHVFISYSRKNADFAIELVRECAKHGIDTWLDTQGLNVGDQWRKEINDAIESAFAIVVVISSTAITSQYVTYEWAYALGLGKKVLPIRLEDVVLHPILEELHHLDFTDGKRKWDALFPHLDQISGDDSSGRIVVDRSAPPAVKDAVLKFEQASPEGWEEAIRTLIAYGSYETALNALQSALRHPVESVCYDAACALLEVGTTEAKLRLTNDEYITLLTKIASWHSIRGFRVEAIKRLGEIATTEAVTSLIGFLHDSELQFHAANILGEAKRFEAVSPLLSMAFNTFNSDENRGAAINALGNIGDPSVTREIMRFAQERGYPRQIYRAAENAMWQIAMASPTPETLFAVYVHPDHYEHDDYAEKCLIELGDYAVACLEQFLKEYDYESKSERLLQQIGTDNAQKALKRHRGY